MPRDGALLLADYPGELVRLACDRCGRTGRYRRTALAARFGPDMALPDMLAALAACDRRGRMHDGCRARYPDLAPPAGGLEP